MFKKLIAKLAAFAGGESERKYTPLPGESPEEAKKLEEAQTKMLEEKREEYLKQTEKAIDETLTSEEKEKVSPRERRPYE